MKRYLFFKFLWSSSILFMSVLVSTTANAQVIKQWHRFFDDPLNTWNQASAVVTDNSGNVYVTGQSAAMNTWDIVTIKYNSKGNEEWVVRYDGFHGVDYPTSITLDKEGNIYVSGGSDGDGTLDDVVTIKYNKAGVQQWVARFNGSGKSSEHAYGRKGIQVDNNGNVYVIGIAGKINSTDDFLTIKYNSQGVQQWVQYFDGPIHGLDWPFGMALNAATGDVYVTGFSQLSNFISAYATVKYNSDGVQQWSRTYSAPLHASQARAIVLDNQGDVYVTGYSSSGFVPKTVTIKYDAAGTQKWMASYLGPENAGSTPLAMGKDKSGNIFITGMAEVQVEGSNPLTYKNACFTLKYNSEGIQQWASLHSDTGNYSAEGKALATDDAGNVFVTGITDGSGLNTNSNYLTIKYNSDGVQQWIEHYDAFGRNDSPADIAVNRFQDVFVTGTATKIVDLNREDFDYLTIKYISSPSIPAKIEAEDFNGMQGVQTEPTSDVCGGVNVGYIDYGDWMDYHINVPAAGQYTLVLRLATPSTSNPQFQVKNGDHVLATVNVPNTGGFQIWQDVTISVMLPAGNQTIRLLSTGGGYWNINWLRFKLPADHYTLIPAKIEAEDWTDMRGVQTEYTEPCGNKNVGYIDYGDWMDYRIQVPSPGKYELKFRLATPSTSNPQFQVKIGNNILTTVNVPNTGGFQVWQDLTVLVTLPAGNQTIRLLSTGGGYWNIDWLDFSLSIHDYVLIPAKIEAEDWSEMQGVQIENSSDAGNGKNVGYIDYGDWMDYKINVPSSGIYEMKLRLATPSISNPQFQVKHGNNVLATVNVPNTRGFQTWQTLSIMINLSSGNQTIRLLSTGGGYWNINWMEFAMPATFTRAGSSNESPARNSGIRLFPNPVSEMATLELNNETEGSVQVDLIGMNGSVLKQFNFAKGVRTSRHTISVSGLPAGNYLLRVHQNGKVETVKLLKF